jgi:hypothetical protein
LIGVVIKGRYDVEIARIPINATSTAEARLTQGALSNSPTRAVFIIETPTFTNPISTPTNPAPILEATATYIPASLTAQKVHTELTGDAQKGYSVNLENGEILVGHGTVFQCHFQSYNEATFLITGTGHFDFELKTGLWDKWINVKPDSYDRLIKEQVDVLVAYGKSPIVVICDSSGCVQKGSNKSVLQPPSIKSQENFPAYPASPVSTPHVSLKDGELLVGTAVRFAAQAYGCNTLDNETNIPYTLILIRGPIELDLEIDNGGWDKWVNVYDNNFAKSLLTSKIIELKKHPNYSVVGHVECFIPPFK